MQVMQALSHDAIQEALSDLPGWSYADQQLVKTFQFGDFKEAMSFLMRLAFHAEAANHHPEIWNVYNQVKLRLTTHDADNQVTEKDVKLAQTIESFNWTQA